MTNYIENYRPSPGQAEVGGGEGGGRGEGGEKVSNRTVVQWNLRENHI
jgi:hypothetical protein